MRLHDFPGAFACCHPRDILTAPSLLPTFNAPALLDTIGSFLGCEPTLYSVNAWWSRPTGGPKQINLQHFHRDDDDQLFLALFVYLTDVDDNGGPHQIIEGSHDPERFPADTFTGSMGEAFSAEMERRHPPASITGPAGTMFLSNTMAIHRGLMPTTSRRLMLWARYGLGANKNSMDRTCPPIPARWLPEVIDTPRLRAVNRLLVDYG